MKNAIDNFEELRNAGIRKGTILASMKKEAWGAEAILELASNDFAEVDRLAGAGGINGMEQYRFWQKHRDLCLEWFDYAYEKSGDALLDILTELAFDGTPGDPDLWKNTIPDADGYEPKAFKMPEIQDAIAERAIRHLAGVLQTQLDIKADAFFGRTPKNPQTRLTNVETVLEKRKQDLLMHAGDADFFEKAYELYRTGQIVEHLKKIHPGLLEDTALLDSPEMRLLFDKGKSAEQDARALSAMNTEITGFESLLERAKAKASVMLRDDPAKLVCLNEVLCTYAYDIEYSDPEILAGLVVSTSDELASALASAATEMHESYWPGDEMHEASQEVCQELSEQMQETGKNATDEKIKASCPPSLWTPELLERGGKGRND